MLGDMLRSERERQGLSIRDIEKGTSIRALYIESIEKGDYSQLPGEVYTKGFIRNYANFLKMDAAAVVKRYMEENHPEKVAEQQAEQEADAAPKAEQQQEKKAMKAQAFSTGRRLPATGSQESSLRYVQTPQSRQWFSGSHPREEAWRNPIRIRICCWWQ